MKDILKNEFGKDIEKIYFIGIGGSSMSGLAGIAKQQGFQVEGSDINESGYTDKLAKQGVTLHLQGQNKDNIQDDVDLVVFTAAISPDNPEMVKAKELGIPVVERSDYLGIITKGFKYLIGVAGTHGKTTTSSMIADILYCAGKDPSVSIGGSLDDIGGNAHLGSQDYFVLESCEFRDSFLKTVHNIGVITNIEEDHLDYFTGGLRQIIRSFHQFGMIINRNGLMVACGDTEEVREACLGLKCPVIYYGKNEDNDWVVKNINSIKTERGKSLTFDVYHHGEKYDSIELSVPGKHNALNALAAIIVADYLGIDKEEIKDALKQFKGAHRRFEFRGSVNDIEIYEDYAHHPTEVIKVIDTANDFEPKELWVVFQPHTYSRTYNHLEDFISAFEGADKVILNDIYSDREPNNWDIFSEDIAKRIKERYKIPTIVMSEFDSIVDFLCNNLSPEDMVLVAGSQTINQVAFMLFDELKRRFPDSEIIEPPEPEEEEE